MIVAKTTEAQARWWQAAIAACRIMRAIRVAACAVDSLGCSPRFPGERGALAVFAGRNAELQNLSAKMERIRDSKGSAAAEGLSLVTGVPGVGKTAMCNEFGRDLAGGQRFFHTITVGQLADGAGVFRSIATAMGKGRLGSEMLGQETTSSSSSVTGSVAAINGTSTKETVKGSPIRDLTALLADSKRRRMWEGVDILVLLIDEVQNATHEHQGVLRALHEGVHGCPIMALCAGLHHSPAVLASLGISRTAQPIELGALTPKETNWAIHANADHYAGTHRIPDHLVQQLASRSHCFPQHIHGYIEGIVKVTREHGVNAVNRWEGQRAIAEHGDQRRSAYYKARLDAMGRDASHVLPAVSVMDGRDSASRTAAEDAIDASLRAEERVSRGEAIVESAIRHGVFVADHGAGLVRVGIPSFRSYLQGLAINQGLSVEREAKHGNDIDR